MTVKNKPHHAYHMLATAQSANPASQAWVQAHFSTIDPVVQGFSNLFSAWLDAGILTVPQIEDGMRYAAQQTDTLVKDRLEDGTLTPSDPEDDGDAAGLEQFRASLADIFGPEAVSQQPQGAAARRPDID